jgi:hypothetical protein
MLMLQMYRTACALSRQDVRASSAWPRIGKPTAFFFAASGVDEHAQHNKQQLAADQFRFAT